MSSYARDEKDHGGIILEFRKRRSLNSYPQGTSSYVLSLYLCFRYKVPAKNIILKMIRFSYAIADLVLAPLEACKEDYKCTNQQLRALWEGFVLAAHHNLSHVHINS
jgi:hypothetical protein